MTRLRKTALGVTILLVGTLSPLVGARLVQAESNEGATPTTQDAERRITGGGLHTCAVLDTGEVQCWGQNDNGQLGNNSVAVTTVPQKVVGITTALGVTGGSTHTCALIHDGTVRCWGNNGSGQLGNGSTSPPAPPVLTPVTVSGLSDATAVAAGGFHTCALRAGGTVVCWGHDGSGQLGNGGDLGTSYVPVTVQVDTDPNATVETLAPLTGATAVTSGEYHSCAIVGATGEVKCWGHNGFGQLGNGITLPGTHSTTAVTVSGIPDDDAHAHDPHKALAITAGEAHTCAILDDNTVRCWGQNFFGQLGNNASGSGTDSSTPVKAKMDVDGSPVTSGDIDDLTDVVSVTAGQFHTCVLRTGGGVRCWGQNGRGQLGDNSTTDRKVAFPVSGVGVARAVTAGGFHTCALVGTALKCWGYNFYGQLGAFVANNPTPVAVTALAAGTVATAGDGHACGLVTSTEVPPGDQPVCWGNNASGELGADLTPSPATSTIPVDVAGIADAGGVGVDPTTPPYAISAGNQFACALPAGSTTPKCWGRGVNGELGNGANASSDVPVAVSGLAGVSQVAAGGELDPVTAQETAHACALLSGGGVRCWGSNGYGQLGNESVTGSNVPVTVRSDHDNDHLHNPPHVITTPIDLTGAIAVAAGGRHSCALMSDTTVRCWGRNANGQLGDGTTGDRRYAVTVDTDPAEPDPDNDPTHFSPLTSVVEITAGARHTCARKSDNTVWCWGFGTSGQLGRNSFTSSDVPVQVHNIGGSLKPVQITAGDFHTCARVKEEPGSLHTFARCWGDNGFGQIGDGTTTDRPEPVAPSRLDEPGESSNIEVVKGMSAGRKNTCAVIIETSVWCWGDNQFGQLGDGIGPLAKTPVNVVNLGSVGGNAIPAPVADAATTAPATAVTVTVLTGDTDPDGTALTVNGIPEAPDRGTVVINGDNTVTYTPNGNFCTVDPTSNVDTFDYSVTDGTATVPATVTITVTCPNTAPTANDDAAATDEESAVVVDVLANDSDINGDPMTVGTVTDPPHGTAVIESNKVKYTPDADFFGSDTFDYTASDDAPAASAPATVTVTVTNVNDAPVAADDTATTAEDTAVTIDVVANDSDTDSPSTAIQSVTDPVHGTTVKASPTTVTYTPASGYCGTDGFSYTLADGSPTNGTDTANVTVTVTCVNDGPNAVDDSATTTEDVVVVVDVLANDTDPESDPLSISAVTDPPHGTAVIESNKVKYTPDPDFCGADDFGYTATDGTESDSALVVPVVVICHNDAPAANDDTATAAEDTPLAVDVLANDNDVDFDQLNVVSATDPAHGTTTVTSTELVNYKPDLDFCGIDTFDYTVSDNYGGTDTATVTVTVTCSNDAPVVDAIGDTSLPWGETLSVPLGASDVDGDAVTFSLVSGPSGVSVTGTSFTWTPTASQVGAHTVIVRATDGSGAYDNESFTVTVGKRATALTYTGPSAGQYSDPTTPSATLLDFDGNPVGGVVVSFTIGTRSGAGLTDGAGNGSATVVLDGPMGAGTVENGFAGNDAYLPSSTSSAFSIDKESATTTYSGRRLVTTSGTSAAVELAATVAEEADGSLGMGTATLQVTFTQVGGAVLCSAPVSGTVPGQGVASCTTSSLGLGSRAVVAKVTSAKYAGPVDVGAFAVAQTPAGSGAGGGRTGSDDFAFQAKPVRKAPPAGDALHVRRAGGLAFVNHTSTLGVLTASCSGGKTKVCTTVVEGSSAARWQVDLATGTVTPLAAGSTLRAEATDATEPDGTGADRYGVTLGAPDSYALPSTLLSAGNIRVTP